MSQSAAPDAPAKVIPESTQGGLKTTVIAEEAEPQNALTQKFTDAEWKALKEFRVSVPILSRLHRQMTYTEGLIETDI